VGASSARDRTTGDRDTSGCRGRERCSLPQGPGDRAWAGLASALLSSRIALE